MKYENGFDDRRIPYYPFGIWRGPEFGRNPYIMQSANGEEDERDLERIKTMFPKQAKMIQQLVEEECDRMEYEGSLMFDEYPDRLMMERVVRHILAKLPEQKEETDNSETDDEIFATACVGCEKNDNSFLQDLVSVLLFQEMYRRRCRHRKCRRWW